MDLDRTVALVILSAFSTLALAGCRGRDPAAGSSAAPGRPVAAPPAARATLAPADTAAYRRGREREVTLMRAAVTRLYAADGDSGARRAAARTAVTTEVEGAGATAAGLTIARYRALVARVDSALLTRAGAPQDDRGLRGGSGRASGALPPEEWQFLDSLRVELAVLQSRFAAAAGDSRGSAP